MPATRFSARNNCRRTIEIGLRSNRRPSRVTRLSISRGALRLWHNGPALRVSDRCVSCGYTENGPLFKLRLCGGELETTGPLGESARCRFLFASARKCCRKARFIMDLPGEARQAPNGVASLLLRASCPSPFGPASLFAPPLRRSGDFSLAIGEKLLVLRRRKEVLFYSSRGRQKQNLSDPTDPSPPATHA